MAKSPTFGSADVFIGDGGPAPRQAEPDAPFRLLIAADFGARGARGLLDLGAALAARKPVRVDADGLDEAMERIGPELKLAGGPTLRFRELDDFHPDRVFDRVPRLSALRDAAEDAAKDAAAARSHRRPSGAGVLDRILSGEPVEEAPPPPSADPAEELAAATRGILHAEAFRSLELAWRGVDFLVRRLDVDGPLTLHLLDVSFDELATDLLSQGPLEKTALHSILVDQTVGTPGAEPWAALVLLSSFERTREEAELLSRLARIGALAGTPVLAGAGASHLGCAALWRTPDPDDWDSVHDADAEAAWALLARRPEARHIGLALPRLLLRVPYGKETDPIEAFDFEELPPRGDHEAYAWGPAALATALLLAEAFLEDGWSLRPGSAQDIGGLPFVTRKVDGDTEALPCAEALLTVRAAEAIGDRGLMPLLSMKRSDAVRLGVFQSLARTPLAGRWG